MLYGACLRGGVYGEGTIFTFSTTGTGAGTLTKLLDVNDSNPVGGGLPPQSSDVCGLTLVPGPDGNLYGTSSNYDFDGSSPNYANFDIFQLTPAGGYTEIGYYLFGPPQILFPGELPTKTPTLYGLVAPENGFAQPDEFFDLPIASPPVAGGSTDTLFTFDTPATANPVTGYPVNDDGAFPTALFLGSDGDLYGSCNDGGANSTGTVFQITSTGTAPNVLYTFSGLTAIGGPNNDGAYPADLIQASDGNFYGVTMAGGANGTGTLFMVDPSLANQFTTLASFPSDAGSPNGIMQASDGNLYGTTENGSSSTIFMYPLKQPNGIKVFDPSRNPVVSGRGGFDFGNGFTNARHPTIARMTFRIENTGATNLTIDCAFIADGPFIIAPRGQPAKTLPAGKSTFLSLRDDTRAAGQPRVSATGADTANRRSPHYQRRSEYTGLSH